MSATVVQGDARKLDLDDASVDLIVTSPPYWSLRSYTDGCVDCAGTGRQQTRGYMERYCPRCGKVFTSGRNQCSRCNVTTLRTDKSRAAQAADLPHCPTCEGKGTGHYDGQIGAEPTPAEYVGSLIDCTREWIRVLKPTGSLWVNLGDKYASSPPSLTSERVTGLSGGRSFRSSRDRTKRDHGVPQKSLIGLPWRYAIRCVDDLGLILRAEVIWSKPNGLPESVTDRVRRSHETWFHLVKQPRYFSAVDAIREEHTAPDRKHGERAMIGRNANIVRTGTGAYVGPNPLGKLPVSVWTIATQPLRVPAELGIDHFAAFPMEWPRRIVQGWSPSGICTACGEGRRPVVAGVKAAEAYAGLPLCPGEEKRLSARPRNADHGKDAASGGLARPGWRKVERPQTAITGEACACPDTSAPTAPAVVLDPFGGTGTTALVADVLGRHGVSVDMSADYCRLAEWRINDPKQRERAARQEKRANT